MVKAGIVTNRWETKTQRDPVAWYVIFHLKNPSVLKALR